MRLPALPYQRAAAAGRAALLCALWLLFAGTVAAQADGEAGRIGLTLRLPEGAAEAVLYTAVRETRVKGGQVTETTTYTDARQRVVQRTEGVYEEASLAPVRYRLEDLRSGEAETLRRDGASVHMTYREARDDQEDAGQETYAAGMLFTPTVTPFIQRNLGKLQQGAVLPFSFLVPSRQDVFAFRVAVDPQARFDVAGVVVRMDPDTWLVRQLVAPLFFVLEAQPPHRVLLFQGRSSVKTDAGKEQVLRYTYAYDH